MNPKELSQLILYIVYQVADLGGYTTTIRLVKFLYLIDLEHYRWYRKTLTNLEWVYYHYGPYAFALPYIGRSLGFDMEQEVFETQRGRTGRLFRVHDPQDFPKGLSFSIESMINGLLQIWADQETPDILDYVYKTEPMTHGVRGKDLDFTVVSRGSRYYELYIPVENRTVNMIKEGLQNYVRAESDETVTPQTKSTHVPREISEALEDERIREYSGMQPTIPDEDELRDTLPKGE